jgi:uncharacterized coiled-coil protein SlyX
MLDAVQDLQSPEAETTPEAVIARLNQTIVHLKAENAQLKARLAALGEDQGQAQP